jgi:hypothetical protein
MGDRVETGNAMRELGVDQMPYRTDPSHGVQQLARERSHGGGRVYTSEAELEAIARKQAAEGLDASFDPARRNFVKQKIEAFDRTQKGILESEVTPEAPLSTISFARNLLDRLRGNKKKGEITGSTAVSEAFAKEYAPFDAKPEAVAPTQILEKALTEARVSTVESGNILTGRLDLKGKVEGGLGSLTEGLPTELTLKQWRGLKGDFGKEAKRLANNPDKAPAARELAQLAEVAAEGEKQALAKLTPAEVAHYGKISEAYKQLKVGGFRTGKVQELLEYGTEKTGSKFTAEQVLSAITDDASAARDFVAALGSEKIALSGRSVVGVADAEITALGRAEAQKVFRPVIEAEIAQVYKDAGGGSAGAKAVKGFFSKKAEVLDTYGVKVDDLASVVSKYDEAMARLSGVKMKVAKDAVGSVLETEPAKIGGFVLDSPNTAAAYKNLLGVSKDPAWKSSIDTLIKDELKARIDAGKDVFGNAKTRAAMEQVFSPTQMRALEAYHTIIKKLKGSPANFTGEKLSTHPGELAVGAAQALPVGMTGFEYVAKYLGKFAAKLGLKAGDDAVLSYLDDAHINPAKAREIVDAYKGSRLARTEMMKGIEKERSAMKTLKDALPKTVPGAAATGIRRKAEEPVLKPETESIPSTFGDEYIQVPRGSSGIRG